MSNDIVQRLNRSAATAPKHESYLMEEAAEEIGRLRREAMKMRITAVELGAIKTSAACMGLWMLDNGVSEDGSMRRAAKTLRRLLARKTSTPPDGRR